MIHSIIKHLQSFAEEEGLLKTRGALNVGLVMTRRARDDGLPLNPDLHLSKSKGQVRGLNGRAGNKILKEYGVTRSIGTEVGRTNRGSVDQMRRYVAFLNSHTPLDGPALIEVEKFWVSQFVQRFASQPFRLRRETGITIQQVIRDLILEADERQAAAGGAMVTGTVLQHLVGAKLDVTLGERLSVEHHSANTSDAHGRGGDFDLGDTVVHVSTSPGELLMAKCAENVAAALRPIVVTTEDEVEVALKLARRFGLEERIEVFAIEQFVSININEIGLFASAGVKATLDAIANRYNDLIDRYEADPSLKLS